MNQQSSWRVEREDIITSERMYLGKTDSTLGNLSAVQETWVWSLGQEDPLEKGMEIHSSILAWRIPWTVKPDGLQSMGWQRVGSDWAINTFTFTFHLGKSLGTCLNSSCKQMNELQNNITLYLFNVYIGTLLVQQLFIWKCQLDWSHREWRRKENGSQQLKQMSQSPHIKFMPHSPNHVMKKLPPASPEHCSPTRRNIYVCMCAYVCAHIHIIVVQLLSCVQPLGTPWTAAHQASLPSPSSIACSNSCPLSQWCHPTISSSVVPFSSCLQSFPGSGSFLTSQFLASGGQSIGVSASVLPMNIGWISFRIDWFDLLAVQGTLTSLFQHKSSKAAILQCSAFFMVQLTSIQDYW